MHTSNSLYFWTFLGTNAPDKTKGKSKKNPHTKRLHFASQSQNLDKRMEEGKWVHLETE